MHKNWSSKFLLRVAKRLQRECASKIDITVPGELSVAGKCITSLKPLGSPFTPGVTKAGRLSLKGQCDGRPVKVYSVFSTAQANLRQAIQNLSIDSVSFPELLAVDNNIVVEEWVDGRAADSLGGDHLRKVEQRVHDFFNECQSSQELNDIAKLHREAFCYFNDYLLARMKLWRQLDLVKKFIDDWTVRYNHIAQSLPHHLSHPDLSAANLIYDITTDRLMSIDNELLGVGHGWLLDRKNSILNEQLQVCSEKQEINEFAVMSWKLRKLGSAFDQADFQEAEKILSSPREC